MEENVFWIIIVLFSVYQLHSKRKFGHFDSNLIAWLYPNCFLATALESTSVFNRQVSPLPRVQSNELSVDTKHFITANIISI